MEPYPTPNIVKQDIHEVLEAVSFVDKIVFGKWNYNKLIGYFNNEKEFYNETARKVLSFCRKKGIGVHIKDGTRTSNGKPDTRKVIFSAQSQKALFEVNASPN